LYLRIAKNSGTWDERNWKHCWSKFVRLCPLDRLIFDSGTVVLLLIALLRWRCREMHVLWLVRTSYG
jgi:hypothetical protein